MNLLIITKETPYGNQETFIIPEIVTLIGRGNNVTIIPRNPPDVSVHETARSIQHYAIKEPIFNLKIAFTAMLMTACYPVGTWKSILLLLQSRNIKVFAKNVIVFPKSLWIARTALLLHVDHIHAHWAATTGTMALVASCVSGIPFSITAHRADIADNNLLKVKSRYAMFFRFISNSGLQIARELVPDFLTNNASVIHMGVSIPDCSETRGPQCRAIPIILCAANLLPVKGHKYLIDAMASLKRRNIVIKLWIAGDGPELANLKAQVHDSQLTEDVVFMGRIPNNDIIALYREHEVDMAVLPSIDLGDHIHEGIPVSLIEAMAHKIPVISTRTGGIEELVDEETGILVLDKEHIDLANAIELLSSDPAVYSKLALNGYNRVRANYNIDIVTTYLLTHFKT